MFDKYLKVPYALGMKEWNVWHAETKRKHSIAYFFYHDFSGYFRHKAYWFKRQYWKLQHTYNPKYQYNRLETGLEAGYYDPDIQIRAAIFHTTVEYCKRNHFVWDDNYERCKARIDLQNVSDWATIIRPRLEDLMDSNPYYIDNVRDYFDCGIFSPDDRNNKQSAYIEAKIKRIDNKMMKIVIDNLEAMWY